MYGNLARDPRLVGSTVARRAVAPASVETAGEGPPLRGERAGEGPVAICCHGLTATRRYVLHGSRVLERNGFEVVTYDARGHGESGPAGPGEGYSYASLSHDLERLDEEIDSDPGPRLLIGHSMGAHTAVAFALRRPERIRGLVLIGPVFTGKDLSEEAWAEWGHLADALEQGGPEKFADAVVAGRGDEHRELLWRLAAERAALHRHPEAVAEALRQVPGSQPFESIVDLSAIECPVLVVASHDEIDSGHPYSAAKAYAEAIPGAQLVSEEKGASPLAWQGGKLSREILRFAEDSGLLGS